MVIGLVEGLSVGSTSTQPVIWTINALAPAPLLWRRSHPGPAAVAAAVPAALIAVVPDLNDLLVCFMALFLGLLFLALHAPTRILVRTVPLVVLEIALGIVALGKVADLVYALLLVALATVPARLLRWRLREVARLTEETVRAEQRSLDAVIEERHRLARELHDIIGHGVSLMVVHAGAARAHLDDPAIAGRSLDAVQDCGRQAVVDLARAMGLLRDDHAEIGLADPSSLAPQPGLPDLPALVAAAREGGADVSLDVHGERARVGGALGLTVYRIVQEGLTNARRYAPTAPVAVSVRVADDGVRVDVVNDPVPTPAGTTSAGTGQGLAGLRERVSLFSGTLTAGPSSGGGWGVHGVLPTDGAGG